MKKTILTMMALCLVTLVWGQEPFCCVTQGAELKYATTDAKGNETGTAVTQIKSVTGSDGNYEMEQTITLYVNGKKLISMDINSTVKDGAASLALGGGAAIEVGGDVPLIPADLSVGQELACGEVKMKMGVITAKQDISSHKVVAEETLTTPAGTFDCYVVEQVYTAKMGIIKAKGTQKIWYARGVGNVKTEIYDKKGKLSSTQLLTELSN